MAKSFKEVTSAVGKFFKAVWKGIFKIPFIARVAIGLAIGVILALVAKKATFFA